MCWVSSHASHFDTVVNSIFVFIFCFESTFYSTNSFFLWVRPLESQCFLLVLPSTIPLVINIWYGMVLHSKYHRIYGTIESMVLAQLWSMPPPRPGLFLSDRQEFLEKAEFFWQIFSDFSLKQIVSACFSPVYYTALGVSKCPSLFWSAREKIPGNREIAVEWVVGVWVHRDSWLGAQIGAFLKLNTNAQGPLGLSLLSDQVRSAWNPFESNC